MMQILLDRIGRYADRGTLEFSAPDGRVWTLGRGDPRSRVRLRDAAVLRRILFNPRLAFSEAYMDGDWVPDGGDLSAVLEVCMRNLDAFDRANSRLGRGLKSFFEQVNTPRRSRDNVHHHYDIDFEIYRRFLDRDLHYSCAYFREPGMDLETAQQAKCAHIAAKLDLKPGARVLDIGCGWGSMALYLAEHHGARCLGITLSQEQLGIARERARQRGLQARVEFRLQDYRELKGRFDAIVSIGMFEHVGRAQFNAFFEQVYDLLAQDGTALLHTIGRSFPSNGTDPWINKHIFPGSYIPPASEIFASVERSRLIASDLEIWRLHYAQTLDHWNARFQRARPEIVARMGERFCRMWEFYLQSCAACFRHSDLVVFHLQLAREQSRLPLTRDYLYARTDRPVDDSVARRITGSKRDAVAVTRPERFRLQNGP